MLWEYKVLRVAAHYFKIQEQEQILNDFGKEGWELAESVIDKDSMMIMIMKRRLNG